MLLNNYYRKLKIKKKTILDLDFHQCCGNAFVFDAILKYLNTDETENYLSLLMDVDVKLIVIIAPLIFSRYLVNLPIAQNTLNCFEKFFFKFSCT